MNLFRLIGDLSHLLAILVLLTKIWRSRSCAGERHGRAGCAVIEVGCLLKLCECLHKTLSARIDPVRMQLALSGGLGLLSVLCSCISQSYTVSRVWCDI